MSMSTAAFSYVGVEVAAASAMEVRWPKSDERTNSNLSQRSELSSLIGKTVKFSAIWISVLATLIYSLSGILISFNIQRTDCKLPRFSWARNETCPKSTTSSVFVSIAEMSKIPRLADAFNFFLIFTALVSTKNKWHPHFCGSVMACFLELDLVREDIRAHGVL